MGLHARDKNKVIRPQNLLFKPFIRRGIVGSNRNSATQNVHGLNVKMVMDRNLAPGSDRKKTKAIIRGLLRACLRQPLDPDILDLVRLPLVGKGLNLILLGVLGVHDDHKALLSLKFYPYFPIFYFTWQEALGTSIPMRNSPL